MNKIIKWGVFTLCAILFSSSAKSHQLNNKLYDIDNTKITSNVAETIFVHRGEKVKVQFDKEKAVYQIRIHNPVGRIIGRFKTASNEFVVETKAWGTGIHFIVISKNGKYKERKKIVVSP